MALAYLQLRTWLSSRLPDRDDERGASLVEYSLLLVFLFVLLVLAVTVIGESTSGGLDDAGSSGFVSTN